MIEFNYETDFYLSNEEKYRNWILSSVEIYEKEIGEINYYFYNDQGLLKINQEHLNHDDYTDIISFDYSIGKIISGDICISIERVLENSKTYKSDFEDELARVMIHGILHFMGYKDKTDIDIFEMRKKEELFIKAFKNS